MSEAMFPVFGPVLVFLCVLPATAIVAKLLVHAADKWMPATWHHALQELRYFLLVMASAAPLLWFVSASLHQAESGEPSGVCVSAHAAEEETCFEPWLFAVVLSLYCSGFAVRRASSKTRLIKRGRLRNVDAEARVHALIGAHPGLHALRGRCEVTNNLSLAVATVGLLVPRVILNASFVEQLDDDALIGTLHHELEHVRGRDPLRYLLIFSAVRVNPWSRMLLDRDMWQWRFERELECDREAVACGASPTAIAEAILKAARSSMNYSVVALGDTDGRALKLRVELLLAYAERPPVPSERHTAFGATVFAAVALTMLPHGGRTWALDAIHIAVEQTILALAS